MMLLEYLKGSLRDAPGDRSFMSEAMAGSDLSHIFYLQLREDTAATSVWYQTEPHAPFPAFPNRSVREVVAS
jgi:hypothetical protein